MPNEQLYDLDGNPVGTASPLQKPTNAFSPTQFQPKEDHLYDLEGNPIKGDLATRMQQGNVGIRPQTFSDQFREGGGKYVRPALSMVGGTAAGTLDPMLAPIGASAGSATGAFLQDVAPKLFGTNPTSGNPVQGAKQALEEGFGQELGGKAGELAFKAARPVAVGTLKAMFPGKIGYEEASKLAQPDIEKLIQTASKSAKTNLDVLSDNVKLARDSYVNSLPNDTNIATPNLSRFAQNTKQYIDSIIPDSRLLSAPDRKILDTIQGIGGPGKTDLMKVEQLQDAISEYIKPNLEKYGNDPSNPNMPDFTKHLIAMKQAVQTDVENAVKKMGPGVYKNYEAAQTAYVDRSNALNSNLAQKLLRLGETPKQTYEDVASSMLQNKSTAQQFLNATGGDRETLQKVALDRISKLAVDPNARTWSAKKALDELEANKDLYSTAIKSNTLSNFKEFLKNTAAQQSSGFPGVSHSVAPWLGGLVLAVPAGILGHMTGHSLTVPISTFGAGSLMIRGLDKQLSKLMSNPTTMRALVEGSKMPVAAPGSSTFGKIIINGLRGATGLTISDINGNEEPINIDQKGQISSP